MCSNVVSIEYEYQRRRMILLKDLSLHTRSSSHSSSTTPMVWCFCSAKCVSFCQTRSEHEVCIVQQDAGVRDQVHEIARHVDVRRDQRACDDGQLCAAHAVHFVSYLHRIQQLQYHQQPLLKR